MVAETAGSEEAVTAPDVFHVGTVVRLFSREKLLL